MPLPECVPGLGVELLQLKPGLGTCSITFESDPQPWSLDPDPVTVHPDGGVVVLELVLNDSLRMVVWAPKCKAESTRRGSKSIFFMGPILSLF
jgi:hypothetical protein